MPSGLLNAFTVDVEDYFHVSAFADRICPSTWDQYQSRVVANTQHLLKRLEDRQVQATFFILGWVADRHPQLVRDIHRAGHEIGCHSYWHQLIYNQTPDEFRADLIRSRDVLEQLTGEPVTAYRAPSFSITARSLWALEILAAEGFTTDSSIFPIHHDRYGMPGAQRFPHRLSTAAGELREFPPSVCRIGGFNFPVSGGGYFRLYPLPFTVRCLRAINRRQQPFMFYIHPWELDPEQPRLASPGGSKFRHYVNLKTTERKIADLLDRFAFDSLAHTLTEHDRRTGMDPARPILNNPRASRFALEGANRK